MSIKIADLLAFVESVKEREAQKKLSRKKDVSPEPLEMPVLERCDIPTEVTHFVELSISPKKRGRKKKV
jgi:hypothetical protein